MVMVMKSWRFEGIDEVIHLLLPPIIWCIQNQYIFTQSNRTRGFPVR